MLKYAQTHDGPFAVRYPRGNTTPVPEGTWPTLEWGTWERVKDGADVVILAGGKGLEYAQKAAAGLDGVGVVNARFVKPLDEAMLRDVARSARAIITVEDNTVVGGFGSAVLEFLNAEGIKTPCASWASPTNSRSTPPSRASTPAPASTRRPSAPSWPNSAWTSRSGCSRLIVKVDG